jgi:hypothetical protein
MGNYWVQAPDGSIVPAPGTGLQQRHIDEISALHAQNAATGPLGATPPAPEHAVGAGHEPNAPTHDLQNQLAQIDRVAHGAIELGIPRPAELDLDDLATELIARAESHAADLRNVDERLVQEARQVFDIPRLRPRSRRAGESGAECPLLPR